MTTEIKLSSNSYVFHKLASFAEQWKYFAFFQSSADEFALALGAKRKITLTNSSQAFDALEEFQSESSSRIAGFLGYDLKNDIEALKSENPSELDFPESVFFEPEAWINLEKDRLTVTSDDPELILSITHVIGETYIPIEETSFDHGIEPQINKDEYLTEAAKLKSHIQRGDIYEVNYCMQFSGAVQGFNPLQQYLNLHKRTEAPFSVFAKFEKNYVISASPERYLSNSGGRLVSQPIKGTKKRSRDPALDEIFMEQLRTDEKERSENVMIVDLVRNDLSRVAKRGSVEVSDLFGLSSFKTVHHMVSTVVAELDQKRFSSWDAIKSSFPMGSMTGAPKISAMELIDEHESFKRSAYSGAFGWMDPNGDFDFNVLIRTILYNSEMQKVSFAVGSALTIKANPEAEFEECLLKAEALIASLEPSTITDGLTPKV